MLRVNCIYIKIIDIIIIIYYFLLLNLFIDYFLIQVLHYNNIKIIIFIHV